MMKRLTDPLKSLLPWGSSTSTVDDSSILQAGDHDRSHHHKRDSESKRGQEHPKTEVAGDVAIPGPVVQPAPVAKPKDGAGPQKQNSRGGESQEGRSPVNSQWADDRDREQRKRKRDQIKDLAKDVETYREQWLSSQNAVAEANRKLETATKAVKALQKEKEEILVRSQAAIKDQVAMAEARTIEVEEKYRNLEDGNRSLREQLRVFEEKYGRVAKLLEDRSADFKGVQTFLTTADLYSGAEIIKMVESLNAEIFQIAAFIAELLEETTMIATQEEHSANVRKYQNYLDFTRRHYIGKVLYAHLANKSIKIRLDPLPMQLAIQAILCVWCVSKTRPFWSDPLGKDLQSMYKGIRASEIQAVSGRWRAITSAQLRSSPSDMGPVLDIIVTLLYLCGWSASSDDAKKSISTMQNKLQGLEKLQIQLKTATKEEITTADMEIYIHPPGDPFEDHMEDTYAENVGDPIGGKDRQLLCSVGMGLRKAVTKRSDSGQLKEQVDVLLKAKVALASVLLDTTSESPKDAVRPQQ
ncbi:hypothetical protein GALMADRAFT_214887 [Galerina marginata CBS 339.88]|uniref:Uncharacterized protein n=1 Tax=Galerina marginata (strain CBS 339.88) TaxID=685588 RepID=A0A067SFT4_GALM3|nr:hypothetical protein GALMADRAFT_214887 [Galerina marginata CBS 339.88]